MGEASVRLTPRRWPVVALAAYRAMMVPMAFHFSDKLNPDVVVPGHGSPGTTRIFDESERYYTLLVERVGALVRQGRTLDQIGRELRMPEYAAWAYQERMPTNVEAAYRAVTQQ